MLEGIIRESIGFVFLQDDWRKRMG